MNPIPYIGAIVVTGVAVVYLTACLGFGLALARGMWRAAGK